MPVTDAVGTVPVRTQTNGDIVAFFADGTTNTILNTIKDASTAAVVGDTALVVALSPNSPLPAGSATIGAVTQGTNPWITSDLADGPVTPGTAATKSMLAGGQFNTALPTLTNGQQAAMQLDSSGRLIIRPLTSSTDTVVANQGTANTVGNAWPTKVTDGTNTAAVKAASTAAIATDPALVVALSPNSPVPAGTNTIGNVNVYSGGNPNSNSNPLFVTVTNAVPGGLVNFYAATSSIAANGTDNTSVYTITATKTLSVKTVMVSASVKMKADFQTSPDGTTYTTKATMFTSPTSGSFQFDTDELEVTDSGTGSTVRVVFTNEDNKAASGYVTIIGVET